MNGIIIIKSKIAVSTCSKPGLGTGDYNEALKALESHKDPVGYGKASALQQAVAGVIDGFLGRGIIGAYYWSHRVKRPARYENSKPLTFVIFLHLLNNGKRKVCIQIIGCHDSSCMR
jgi:hypothetical protein